MSFDGKGERHQNSLLLLLLLLLLLSDFLGHLSSWTLNSWYTSCFKGGYA